MISPFQTSGLNTPVTNGTHTPSEPWLISPIQGVSIDMIFSIFQSLSLYDLKQVFKVSKKFVGVLQSERFRELVTRKFSELNPKISLGHYQPWNPFQIEGNRLIKSSQSFGLCLELLPKEEVIPITKEFTHMMFRTGHLYIFNMENLSIVNTKTISKDHVRIAEFAEPVEMGRMAFSNPSRAVHFFDQDRGLIASSRSDCAERIYIRNETGTLTRNIPIDLEAVSISQLCFQKGIFTDLLVGFLKCDRKIGELGSPTRKDFIKKIQLETQVGGPDLNEIEKSVTPSYKFQFIRTFSLLEDIVKTRYFEKILVIATSEEYIAVSVVIKDNIHFSLLFLDPFTLETKFTINTKHHIYDIQMNTHILIGKTLLPNHFTYLIDLKQIQDFYEPFKEHYPDWLLDGKYVVYTDHEKNSIVIINGLTKELITEIFIKTHAVELLFKNGQYLLALTSSGEIFRWHLKDSEKPLPIVKSADLGTPFVGC